MGTPTLNIADIECARGSPWRIESGGDLYRRYLFEALRKRFNVEPLGILLGRGNWLFQRTKLAWRLFQLIEQVEEIDYERLVNRYRGCKTLDERKVVLRDEARKWGVTEAEFLLMLRDRIKRFKK